MEVDMASIADMDEAQREYEQVLETAVFESTEQLLNELICRMRTHRSRIVSRLHVISQMEHSLLEMLDETGLAKWAENRDAFEEWSATIRQSCWIRRSRRACAASAGSHHR